MKKILTIVSCMFALAFISSVLAQNDEDMGRCARGTIQKTSPEGVIYCVPDWTSQGFDAAQAAGGGDNGFGGPTISGAVSGTVAP